MGNKMTKEPIMIDNVDVSKCTYSKIGIDNKYYCEEHLYDDGTPVFTCGECTDCYFKQLKKLENEFEGHIEQVTDLEVKLYDKEQECEALRDKLNTHIDSMNKQNEKLFNENKQLKLDLEKEKALKQTYLACYKTKHRDAKNKLFKYEIYKQALQEIKNFIYIEKAKVFVDMEDFWEQILQKCEVIKE